MKKKTVLRAVHIVFICAWIAFVFSNSLRNGLQSSGQSGAVVEAIKELFGLQNVNEVLIRKMAHFLEYFLLGGVVSLSLWLYDLSNHSHKNWLNGKFLALVTLWVLGFIIAVIDENLQRLSPGRSCQFTDMLIDYAGYILAFGGVFAVKVLVSRRKKTVDK